MGHMTTMTRITNDPYFEWLYRISGLMEHGSYQLLAAQLHQIPFKPVMAIDNDANRANDGLYLRVQFIERYGVHGSSASRGVCTMLEFLVGLAKRMNFLMSGENEQGKTKHYFWCMIQNLRLTKLDDESFYILKGEFFVEEAINRVLERTYDFDGNGGLFPVKNSQNDQRHIEIWYQMQQWLLENGDLDIW